MSGPDPDRKPTKQEMRATGMVALVALVVLAGVTIMLVLLG